MSADPESISSGRSFPQWLKSKTDSKFDFDGQAVSPPAHDESFFYIRYPSGSTNTDQNLATTSSNTLKSTIADALSKQKADAETNRNMVQHTEPCKKFLNNRDRELVIDNVKHPPKPFGTDDGFKGAGAACGSSIVKVAHQMVTAKSLGRGFTVANNFSKDSEEVSADPMPENEPAGFADAWSHSSRSMMRRGSKSLPASPFGSPKTMRRSQNPYFTTATFSIASPHPNANGSTEGVRGWLLSSLLGMQRDTMSSTTSIASSHISEETEELQTASAKAKSSNGSSRPIKARPSELREMNFWTPTST